MRFRLRFELCSNFMGARERKWEKCFLWYAVDWRCGAVNSNGTFHTMHGPSVIYHFWWELLWNVKVHRHSLTQNLFSLSSSGFDCVNRQGTTHTHLCYNQQLGQIHSIITQPSRTIICFCMLKFNSFSNFRAAIHTNIVKYAIVLYAPRESH